MEKCKSHPKYKGIRYPWSECKECLKIYHQNFLKIYLQEFPKENERTKGDLVQ